MSFYAPPQTPLDILFEDAEMIVVSKPAGLLSVPGRGPELADCLIGRLREVFPGVLLVHRLDRDTSGVMVFAQTAHAQRYLSHQFERRSARKTYVARLIGRLEPRTGVVDLPLCVDWDRRPRQIVDHERGREAVTNWRVQRYDGETTRVQLMPKTGRSHQLRVHMLELGHPILGDPLYAPDPGDGRMMLHSTELRIKHPNGGHSLRFQSAPEF